MSDWQRSEDAQGVFYTQVNEHGSMVPDPGAASYTIYRQVETATGVMFVQEKIGGGSNYSADGFSSASGQKRQEPDSLTIEDVGALLNILATALVGMILWAMVIGAVIHCLLQWLLVPTMLITYIVLVVLCVVGGLVSRDLRSDF